MKKICRTLAGVAPILDKVAGAATQDSPPNLALPHKARIRQSCIEAITQKFLEASAAKEERINTHVERIVGAFTAPAITSQSAAAQNAGIVASQHVADPEVAAQEVVAQHVAAPEVTAQHFAVSEVAAAVVTDSRSSPQRSRTGGRRGANTHAQESG
ncbi:hypothetical protein CAEBREN_04639 [Caenorhabditis brenneri]|uniref:Uncharacterized protein n=1 Tax=Caenorhabditis brenneri TaxID=135651 RepID=G0PA11_CAEBE|nr:hypothetical protein CAEBREN_04639 [Caenorhabditis brenneri]